MVISLPLLFALGSGKR